MRLVFSIEGTQSHVEPSVEASCINEFEGDYGATLDTCGGAASAAFDAGGKLADFKGGFNLIDLQDKFSLFANDFFATGDDKEITSWQGEPPVNF